MTVTEIRKLCLHQLAAMAYKSKVARQGRYSFNAVNGRYPL
ncbi:MAG: hypothetical protein H6Q07_1658, partial [Acidobacteria bacterium]|nr:hypothetical protein [Acidobacteriota bacterium]